MSRLINTRENFIDHAGNCLVLVVLPPVVADPPDQLSRRLTKCWSATFWIFPKKETLLQPQIQKAWVKFKNKIWFYSPLLKLEEIRWVSHNGWWLQLRACAKYIYKITSKRLYKFSLDGPWFRSKLVIFLELSSSLLYVWKFPFGRLWA